MKKFMFIVVFMVLILLINVHFVSADSIGMRKQLLEKDYISLHSTAVTIPDNTFSSWNVSIGGKYTLSPSLIIGFGDSLNRTTINSYVYEPLFSPQKMTQTRNHLSLRIVYLFGSDFLLNLDLGLYNSISKKETDFQTYTDTNTNLDITLTAEYIFLNKPLYQLASTATVGNTHSGFSLLGSYNITPILKLDGSSFIGYTYYTINYLSAGGSIKLTYKEKPFQTDLLLETGFYFCPDSTYIPYDKVISLTLNSNIPISDKFPMPLLFNAVFESINLSPDEAYVTFTIKPGVEYSITTDLKVIFAYKLLLDIFLDSGSTTSSFYHQVSLTGKYSWKERLNASILGNISFEKSSYIDELAFLSFEIEPRVEYKPTNNLTLYMQYNFEHSIYYVWSKSSFTNHELSFGATYTF